MPETAAEQILAEALTEAAVLISAFEGPGTAGIVPAEILARAHDALMELSLGLVQETDRLESERTALIEEASVDALTGVANRRRFDEFLAQQSAMFKRHGSRFSLLMIDVDYFKKVNDQHGHPAGDQVLKQLATVIRNSVRATDFVARYGGEEFAAILPEASTSGASVFAERIRSVLAATPICLPSGEVLQVTVSIGIATAGAPGRVEPGEILQAADQALYTAKHGGRNAVRSAA